MSGHGGWHCYLAEKWPRLTERWYRFIDFLRQSGRTTIARFQSAWQATTEELQYTWRHLTPLRLPKAWQARALLGLLVFILAIPGISYYLARPLPSPPPPAAKPLPANFRTDDTNLLARLVAAEAQDEPYPGQVAVVAVVLNRLRDPNFPKTVAGIIFEPWAFESVANGRYWQVQVLARDYAATHDAMNDWDPSNGALYFFNPAKATSPWIWTRPQITQIGNHIFTR
ncbi:cell wall hydrolase [Moorella naiadis]|uniref:cell wall hydrolase n=1 Tax=Moorella naiadis (nom. illeg.) TaxID=3093670 RepID=UPI003D9CA397